ncbi:MAG: sulfatase-like hydrolase/transferase [Gemmataceae bacterium]
MHRILYGILATAIFLAVSATAHAADKPNIILIMADDIGYECFGCYGGTSYQTPVLDRLARHGMRFEHCYAQPLCTPTRVKLMTGKSNVRNYVTFSILKRGERTFGHMMQEAGYKTAVAGKWQLYGSEQYPPSVRGKGTLPRDAGFDRYCLWQVQELKERYWGPYLDIDGQTKQFPKDVFGPDVVAQYIMDFMEQNQDRPFFVYYPMILVHDPFVKTPDSKKGEQTAQQNFGDMVAYMDKLVGRIVDQVEKLGLSQKTVIMFTGDNGTHPRIRSHMGDQVIQGGKGLTTDAGTRVPLIAHWPGTIPAGRVSDALIDFSDFYPTLAALSGAKIDPNAVDGQSFLPQLRGMKGPARDWIHIYYCPRPPGTKPVRFTRDQRWKLYDNGDLFDVANDVLEQQPIRQEPPNSPAAQARAKLQKALDSMPATGQSLLRFE